MTTRYDDEAVQAFVTRAGQLLSTELTAILLKAGRKLGEQMVDLFSEYPPDSGGRPLPKVYTRTDAFGRQVKPYLSKFKSAAQQYFVLKLAERGGIPRKRTGKLGQSMTAEARGTADEGILISAGTNLSYAGYVIGEPRRGGVYDYTPGQQSHYHQQTGWVSLPDQLQRNAPGLVEGYGRAVQALIDAALRGN